MQYHESYQHTKDKASSEINRKLSVVMGRVDLGGRPPRSPTGNSKGTGVISQAKIDSRLL